MVVLVGVRTLSPDPSVLFSSSHSQCRLSGNIQTVQKLFLISDCFRELARENLGSRLMKANQRGKSSVQESVFTLST